MSKEIRIPDEIITSKIYLIRGQKVMLDRDLAELYIVETKRLKEAVRRNSERFPEDFMFEMEKEEFQNWRTQFATSKSDRRGLRYAPFCFTEHGVLMLSSVLNSDRAIAVNIQIIRVFTKIREMLSDTLNIRLEVEEISNNGEYITLIKEKEFNKDMYNKYRNTSCSRVTYVIGKNKRIIDKFQITNWKLNLPQLFK